MFKRKRYKYPKAYELILRHIDEGLNYSESLSVICGKFRITDRSFNNYWNDAQKEHKHKREAINKKKLANTIKKEIKADDERILGRIENLIILSEIARNVEEKANERINAIKTINQMQGYDAPSKIDLTTKGRSLRPNITFTRPEDE